jgi:transcriptional regulator with GAF, ATPase, and Fis domain
MNAASLVVDFIDTPREAARFESRRPSQVRPPSLTREDDSLTAPNRIVGGSRALRHVLQQVDAVVPTDATVLITGESGTGKELIAREVHRRGPRSRRPFVKVNCSAIPREICESEFFGHVRGAFTGAVHERPGRFQIADGGTIFLDEVGDLPVEMQPKLLRVLQEGEYERVGEDRTRTVDVRVIAATNHHLAEEVRARRFRQDLFYRLNVFPLELPPLRARRDDIPELAAHTIARMAKKHAMPAPPLTHEDVEWLQRYDWPGNIRELQNLIERAVILSKGVRLRLDVALPRLAGAAPESISPSDSRSDDAVLTDRECRERERANVMRALDRCEGRVYGQGGAAELLGLNPTTLASRLRALKITPPKTR